jgi:hypothetical protein
MSDRWMNFSLLYEVSKPCVVDIKISLGQCFIKEGFFK